MKNMKLITLMSMLAILSFSCKEEEEEVVDEIDYSNVERSKNAHDYLFRQFSKYSYNHTFRYAEDEVLQHRMLEVTTDQYFPSFGRTRIEFDYQYKYRDVNNYFAADSTTIYSRGHFFNFSRVNTQGLGWKTWIPTLSLSDSVLTIWEQKENWGNSLIDESITSRKIGEIEIIFKNKRYLGYEFLIEMNVDNFYSSEDWSLKHEYHGVQKVKLLDGLGLIYLEYLSIQKNIDIYNQDTTEHTFYTERTMNLTDYIR